jgi:hypothetical protein
LRLRPGATRKNGAAEEEGLQAKLHEEKFRGSR